MPLHRNMPFSLPLTIGRSYFHSDSSADETTDVLIGSEIEPRRVGRKTMRNGQRMDYWLIVQHDVPIILSHWNGRPDGIEKGCGYDLGYRQVGFLMSSDLLDT